MPKTLKTRRGGTLNYSEYRGGANMDEEDEMKEEMKGGKLRKHVSKGLRKRVKRGGNMQEEEIIEEMKGGKLRKRGYKGLRKSVKRGGSSLGGMFGGMESVTGTINSLFGTKF